MSTLLLQEYVERISRLIQTESRSNGLPHNLQPIQLNALHFLTRANRYSNAGINANGLSHPRQAI